MLIEVNHQFFDDDAQARHVATRQALLDCKFTGSTGGVHHSFIASEPAIQASGFGFARAH